MTPNAEPTSLHEEGLYPIRSVAAETGVNPVTLRAWERRYGLIKPQRTPKGHRLYSREDIERIHRILELLARGVAISQVRKLLDEPQPAPPAPTPLAPGETPWDDYSQRMRQCVERFDEAALEALYNDALSLYPLDMVAQRLLLPLVGELKERQPRSPRDAAHARFLLAYLRNKIGARFHHQSSQAHGPRLLAACLPGEDSEIELLLIALMALNRGFRVTFLGRDTPLDALPLITEKTAARAMVLYGNVTLAAEDVQNLERLARATPQPVFVCGQYGMAHEQTAHAAGLRVLQGDPQTCLEQLERQLGGR